MKKAIVLLSGGMDSAVTLYEARRENECFALTFSYGQKAAREVRSARKVAEAAGVPCTVLEISLPWKGSALLDGNVGIPEYSQNQTGKIPGTYVPARNILFLSYAVSYAEAVGASSVYIGAHQLDFSNYPDCREVFFDSYREMVRKGTRAGSEGRPVEIVTPIINMTKKQIVEEGVKLGVPFEHTWSCYSPGDMPCGKCESCMFRARAFEEAGMADPFYKG
ncbi:MAG TPA: 7-cyano-7-deazaguanine synthase QueC [Candidatus Omnitrophota bacterium]|nr:7-cyano-7-deazaguanine synthase QueC [Candidatus Omnitrophota bacterium]